MSTIGEKLAYLEETKKQIKESIIAKGVEVKDEDTFRSYAGKILNITSGGASGEENAIINPTAITSHDTTSVTTYLLNKMLVKVPLIDTSNWVSISYLFYYCYRLLEIPKINTDKTINMEKTFYWCSDIKKIPELNAENVTNTKEMFYYCSNLVDFGGLINIGKSFTKATNNYSVYVFDLSKSNLLTHDSLMNVINNLYDLNLSYDVANGGTLYTQSLILGNANKAKLTADEIAIATNKGWTIS